MGFVPFFFRTNSRVAKKQQLDWNVQYKISFQSIFIFLLATCTLSIRKTAYIELVTNIQRPVHGREMLILRVPIRTYTYYVPILLYSELRETANKAVHVL